jgi:hypothetical protein
MTSPKTWIATLVVTCLLSLSFAAWTTIRWTDARVRLVAAETALKAAEAALLAAKAREAVAVKKTKWRQKAAARAKRLVVWLPAGLGTAALVLFEERDYREWRSENQDIASELEARKLYVKEMYELAREALEEELGDWKVSQPVAWKKALEALEEWHRSARSKSTG